MKWDLRRLSETRFFRTLVTKFGLVIQRSNQKPGFLQVRFETYGQEDADSRRVAKRAWAGV
jgi:hypothetical protein